MCQSQTTQSLSLSNISDLEGFIPFSDDIDIDQRLADFGTLHSTTFEDDEIEDNEDEDEYIVEEIVKKKFNSSVSQFVYFVKWKGYSTKHNTWELISNIPDDILQKYEKEQMTMAHTNAASNRLGLRDRSSLKSTYNPDFISTS